METQIYILKEKRDEFDKVFIKKAEELDKRIENLWSKIISEEKLINIFEDKEDFEDTLDDVRIKKFDNGYRDEIIFQFTKGDDYNYMHFLKLKEDGKIDYNLSDFISDKDNNNDMLDPRTDREWEEDIEFKVVDLVQRQMNYIKEKKDFLTFSEKQGEEIFNKYYSHLESKINKEMKEIDNMIKEIEKM